MIPNVIIIVTSPGDLNCPHAGLTMYTDGDPARTGQKGACVLGHHLTSSCDILRESFFTLRLLAYL